MAPTTLRDTAWNIVLLLSKRLPRWSSREAIEKNRTAISAIMNVMVLCTASLSPEMVHGRFSIGGYVPRENGNSRFARACVCLLWLLDFHRWNDGAVFIEQRVHFAKSSDKCCKLNPDLSRRRKRARPRGSNYLTLLALDLETARESLGVRVYRSGNEGIAYLRW